MASPQDIQIAIDKLTVDSGLMHQIIHGDADTVVTTEGGLVPSVAKVIADLSAQIVTGFEAGYVVVVANTAARNLAVPAQAGQLLIQMDTKDIYYGTATTAGAWTKHPVQEAADIAIQASEDVAELATQLAGKMTAATYVGGSATGFVRTAERIKALVDFIVTNQSSALFMLGVENGSTNVVPVLGNHRAVDLVDGGDNHTDLYNTSRRCQGIGTNFAFVNSPRRLISWGGQPANIGTLGSGVRINASYHPRTTIAEQQASRNLPGFDPNTLYTAEGEPVQVTSQNGCTVVRTVDGLILVAGGPALGVKPIFGSGVDKLQSTLQPIYFNQGGVNQTIRLFDIQDSYLDNFPHSTGLFVDDNEGVWLLTTNSAAAGYGNSLVGAQNIPVRLNAGFPSWAGKVVQKIRCDCTGGIFILFTNGELWGGGGKNNAGYMNTGSTANVLNPVQIATGVDDFEVSGQENQNTLALWILQSNILKACGYNGAGQFGQSASPLVNRTSFVQVGGNGWGDVDRIRLGGTDVITVFMRKTNGTWWGVGQNTQGVFGQGSATAAVNTPTALTNLDSLIASQGALVTLCLSGYNGKHSVCAVFVNGQAWCAGDNSDGCLANGTVTATATWTRVLWSPRDATEKIVDVTSAVGPNKTAAFTWITNHGRILGAGSSASGFATGIQPVAAYQQVIASPIQIGTV